MAGNWHLCLGLSHSKLRLQLCVATGWSRVDLLAVQVFHIRCTYYSLEQLESKGGGNGPIEDFGWKGVRD